MPLLSRILKRLLLFIGFLVLFVGILDHTNISFKSEIARQVLLESIKTYTGRSVSIDGDVYLTVSISPRLLVKQIHIRNIDGFGAEDFITVTRAGVEVSLLPLLSGTFHLEEIVAEQAKIRLIKNKDGSHNWSFDHVNGTTDTKPEAAKVSLKKQRRVKRLSLGLFVLTDVSIIYQDESRDQIIENRLEHLMIDIKDIAKPQAEISGSSQGSPYQLSFESEPLHSLASGQPWLLNGTGKIAGSKTSIEASIQLKENRIESKLDVNVKKVDLGLLLDTLGIISAQDAATDYININAKLRGSDLVELYQDAEISLQLGKGYWNLQDTGTGQKKELSFSSASSFAAWNKPVELHLNGMIAGEVITLDFKTNRLLEFFDEVHTLDVDLKSAIAGIETSLKGRLDLPVKTKQFQLDITLNGNNLEKLNPILDAELPAFNDFSLSGKLLANEKGYVLKSTDVSIGDSHIQTSIVIDTSSFKPLWIINLRSRQLQLKDFAPDIHNLQPFDKTTSKTSKQKTDDLSTLKPVHRLIDIIQAPKMHFNLNLKVDKLLSGEDVLGKARFQLNLRDNVVGLKNADIEMPGGKIAVSATFEVMNDKINGNTELNIDKFDYGIVARIFDQEAKLDGMISTRVNLEFIADDITQLLEHATGQVDFALWPKDTRPAKILNLWATNLYLILLPELKKKESKVNCIVGLMNLEDGKMNEEFFAIDTTKLWIYGNFKVDFEQKYIELSLFPQSKTARLFSLQSPIRARGKFSDIRLEINPLDLTGSYLSFITSPLHVPTRWIFDDHTPGDGSAVCEQLFDRNYVENLKEKLRKKEQAEINELLDSDD
jgi:uncharacterized protein involved in outer membrane biogenesis